MTKLIYTKGLPGSGKSTWAAEYVAKHPETVRVNRDDLRAMLFNARQKTVLSAKKEQQITTVQNSIIANALAEGKDVLVDDMNLNKKFLKSLKSLAQSYRAQVEEKDFTDIPLATCIERDAKRQDSLGEDIIRRIYERHLMPPLRKTTGKPECVIVDIDGSLAQMGDRGPFDWMKVHLDSPKRMLVEIVNLLSEKYVICVTSGRDSVCYDLTEEWLVKHGIHFDHLFMRTKDDNRKDAIVKQELLHKEILPLYDVALVFDDRTQVVDLWRSEGLECYQVAPGRF